MLFFQSKGANLFYVQGRTGTHPVSRHGPGFIIKKMARSQSYYLPRGTLPYMPHYGVRKFDMLY